MVLSRTRARIWTVQPTSSEMSNCKEADRIQLNTVVGVVEENRPSTIQGTRRSSPTKVADEWNVSGTSELVGGVLMDLSK